MYLLITNIFIKILKLNCRYLFNIEKMNELYV